MGIEPPFRDVTVGSLLTRLAAVLSDRPALLYAERDLRWTFARLETVERERCTALYGVPTMLLAELEDPEFARFDLRSLRTGIMAGAPCPEPLMRRVIAEMHLTEMTIAYGLTETSPGVTVTDRFDSLERRTR